MLTDGENAGLVRAERAELGGLTAKQYGVSKFERSDKGWPIVDISQLDTVVVSHVTGTVGLLRTAYSIMPITFGSIL